jgi:3-hydroxybutyryl-CoA dehydrogenase
MKTELVVVGGGTMGAGIATSFLAAGRAVRLVESSPEFVESAEGRVRGSLERMARKNDAIHVDETLDRLELATDHEGDNDAVVALIEAVPEDLELKQRLFESWEPHYPTDALLASNTSSLPIAQITGGLEHPERGIGMHFFNPVPVSSLVELVVAEHTSDLALERARTLAESLDKTPIVVRDSPGFASSRLGLALGLEAIRMLEDGVASADDIDTAMQLGYKHPMGPLRLTDLVGLDVRLAIAEHLAGELGPRFEPPALLKEMVANGELGKKTGRGFHEWT